MRKDAKSANRKGSTARKKGERSTQIIKPPLVEDTDTFYPTKATLKEAIRVTNILSRSEELPEQARTLTKEIHDDLLAIRSVRPPKFKTTGTQEEAAERYIEKKTATERRRVVENIKALDPEVKKHPKYSSVEFKCISDYKKCQEHLGNYNLHCGLAYLICLGRRLIPLVHQSG